MTSANIELGKLHRKSPNIHEADPSEGDGGRHLSKDFQMEEKGKLVSKENCQIAVYTDKQRRKGGVCVDLRSAETRRQVRAPDPP